MRTTLVLLLSLLAAPFAPALAGEEPKLVGHWEGALVITPAEQEVDVALDFSRAGGQLRGQLQFPITADGAHEVENLVLTGSHVSFSVKDKEGVVSAFEGSLSPDGTRLEGKMTEKEKAVPFLLHPAPVARPVGEIPTYKLSGDGIQLKTAFNNDVGKTRLILLVNMGSFSSRMALRVIERFVMEKIVDPNLRVYLVWLAPDVPTAETVVRQEAALAPDPRITRFWSTDPAVVRTFAPLLAPYKPVADPCFVFGPGKSWTAAEPPLPDQVRVTRAKHMQPGQKLNGIELATDVQLLLATQSGR